jgi:hypothetical protein
MQFCILLRLVFTGIFAVNFYFILFYFILFYFILFYFILFYFILFYFFNFISREYFLYFISLYFLTAPTYISAEEGTGYFAGGFFGGTYENFVRVCQEIAENIEADLRAEVPYIALWHDESHLNRYFVSHPPTIRLPPNCIFVYVCCACAVRVWCGGV